jgi:hypothetical protein
LKYPFFDLYKHSKRDVLEIRETIYNGDGERLEILWKVARNIDSAFPSLLARKIFWKVIVPTIDAMFRPISRFIYLGSLRDISRITGETNRERLKEALESIVGATVLSRGTFYLKAKKIYIDETFHLFNQVYYAGNTLPDGTDTDGVIIELGTFLHQNINEGYNVPIDWDFHQSLQGEITSRMYELLSLDFFVAIEQGRRHVDKTYSRWCPFFPIVPQDKLWKAKQQLRPAINQLLESQFFGRSPDFFAIPGQSADWIIRLYIGPRAIEEYERNKGSKEEKLPSTRRTKHIPSPKQPRTELQPASSKPSQPSGQSGQEIGQSLTPHQADFIIWLESKGVTRAKKLLLTSPWKDAPEILEVIKQDFLSKCDRAGRGEFAFKKGKKPWLSWAVSSSDYKPPENIETPAEREARERLHRITEHNDQIHRQIMSLENSLKRIRQWFDRNDADKICFLKTEAEYACGKTDEERQFLINSITANPDTAIAEAKARKEGEAKRLKARIAELKGQIQRV